MQTAVTDVAAFSREMRMLLAALQVSWKGGESSSESLREHLCGQPLHWEGVMRLASWHGVSGLLARQLQSPELSALVSHAARMQLERRTRERSFLAMTQVAALGEIARAMESAGVPTVAWKGPALSLDLYGSYALRGGTDLDFLVESGQMQEAVRNLRTLGFVHVSEWATGAAKERAARLNHEVQMVRARDRMAVELHDEVMPQLFVNGLAIESCVARARWLQLDMRVRVRVPAPQDLLVSLCAHGAKHGWERLKWVCDIAAFVERYRDELSWEQMIERARAASSLGALLGGVRLAEELLAARQPEELRSYWRHEAAVRRVVLSTAERLASGSMGQKTARIALQDALNTVVTRRARAGYLVRRAFTIAAIDVERFPVPEKLALLRYPLRAARVTRKVLAPGRVAGKSGLAASRVTAAVGRRLPVHVKSFFSMRRLAIGAECVAALVLARVGLKVAKLSDLSQAGCRISGWMRTGPVELPERAAQETAAWVDRTSRLLPGMLCLQQALATQWMLARRGGACTLHVGVLGLEGEFRSHAWVSYKGRVLIGGRQAPEKYREILRSESMEGPKRDGREG